jgi:8-oxo-dGTP pyrophosphatase MutT (NUDIX family)
LPADYLARVREEIEAQREELTAGVARQPEFYVFFSFDLVNSTLFKSLNQAEWPLVTHKFYEFVEDSLRKHVSDAGDIRLWKYVGDELLLYRRIRSLADLRACVPAAHQTLLRTAKHLWMQFPDTRTVLAVKATVWCAKVVEPAPADLQVAREQAGARDGKAEKPIYPNILVRANDEMGRGQRDFLGPDIDIGFRIAKHALRQRLVVSADLAYLLFRDRAEDERGELGLRIVSFEQLKGVWDNRHYPIFWYEPDWSTVSSSFAYDERFHHPIVRDLTAGKPLGRLGEVSKILEDVGRTQSVEELWEFVRSLETTEISEIEEAPGAVLNGTKEVHCVAVCFRSDGRVLLAKRPASKSVHPRAWEFGCGQLGPSDTFADCLRRAYLEDFNLEIDVDDEPTPVSTYIVDRGQRGGLVPGIVFVAEVQNSERAQNRKHDEIQWVDPDDLGIIAGEPTVPKLRETIRRAADIRRQRHATTDNDAAASAGSISHRQESGKRGKAGSRFGKARARKQ